MKNKMMMIAAAGMLTIAGLAYGFTSSNSCPLAGTPDCPYDKATTAVLPCCKK